MTKSCTENRPKLTYGKIANTAVLTPEIISKIDSVNFTPCERNKVILLLKLLIRKIERDNLSPIDFIDLPVMWFRKAFGGNYHKWLRLLINNNLLRIQTWINYKGEEIQYEPGPNRRLKNGQSKRYGFAPGLLTTNVEVVEYHEKVKAKKSDEKFIKINEELWDKIILLKELTCFNFYPERLLLMVDEVAKIKADEIIKIDATHPIKFFMEVRIISTNTKLNKISIYKALKIAQEENSDLLKDGDKIIICKLNDYKIIKQQNCTSNYSRLINKLKLQEFYMRRNSTNNRLDHNLTSLPKQFLNKIILWNDKIELDECNSQLSKLTYWMNNLNDNKINEIIKLNSKLNSTMYVAQCWGPTPPQDLQLWNFHTSNETIYEFVAKELNLSSRAEGKEVMFNILFSKYRNNTKHKARLKKIFPTVIKFIDDFKKYAKENLTTGESSFANTLSSIESYIFIDKLLPTILSAGYHCIPKHDSLIIDRKDYHSIKQIIFIELKKMNYTGAFKDNYNEPTMYVAQCLYVESKKIVSPYVNSLPGQSLTCNYKPVIGNPFAKPCNIVSPYANRLPGKSLICDYEPVIADPFVKPCKIVSPYANKLPLVPDNSGYRRPSKDRGKQLNAQADETERDD